MFGSVKHILTPSEVARRSNSSDLGWILGYRFIHNRGFGLVAILSKFDTHTRGDYATNDEVTLYQFGALWRIQRRIGKSAVSIDPMLTFGFESSWTDDLVNGIPSPDCWDCGDGNTSDRRYVVPGIFSEYTYGPLYWNMSIAIGGRAQAMIDISSIAEDAVYAPKLRGAFDAHFSIVVVH